MVLTRAQRQQSKDDPSPPKPNALKEPARRGKKKPADEPVAEEPKPKTTRTAAAANKSTKAAAPTARKTRAKEPEPAKEIVLEPLQEATAQQPEPEETKSTKRAPATRKRPAKDLEPPPPAKRTARGKTATKEPAAEAMEEEAAAKKTEAAPAPRATRATRGTKASEKRAAATVPAVKPLAQRIKVAAKKPAKKTKKQMEEEKHAEESIPVEEPAPEATVAEDKKPAEAAVEVPEQTAAPEQGFAKAESNEVVEKEGEIEQALPLSVESEEAKATDTETQEPIIEDKEAEVEVEKSQEEAKEGGLEKQTSHQDVEGEQTISTSEDKMDIDEVAPATPTKSPQRASKIPVRTDPQTPESSNGKPSSAASLYESSYKKQTTPQTNITVATTGLREKSAHKVAAPITPEKLPTAVSNKTHTPFESSSAFKSVSALKTSSVFSHAKPSAMKDSLLLETPRRNPIASPLKFPLLSAAKRPDEKFESVLGASPARKAPFVASTIGQTPLRATSARPESVLQTPARKGLMLPPSTAPVQKHGQSAAFSTSSLLQTCPRKIALPELPFKSCMASASKAQNNEMGSSLLHATPKRVHIELPSKETTTESGVSTHDFASHAKSSLIGGTPRRPKTPAKTPGKSPMFSLDLSSKRQVSEGGSPIMSRATPAGLRDVASALEMLQEDDEPDSPLMRPSTPTEQIMLGVIEDLDYDMPEAPSENTQQPAAVDDTESLEKPDEEREQSPVEEHAEQQSFFEEESMGEFIMTDETPMEEKKNPFDNKIVLARPDASVFDEPSILSIDEPTLQLQNEIEFATPRANRTMRPTANEEPETPVQTAKKEKRSRHARLSLAIQLEDSIKKPRQSAVFIPSLSPTKSALKSPMKKYNLFGSPKKSVTWVEPEEPKIQEEEDFNITIPCPDAKLLFGTSVFVDVRGKDGGDASDIFIELLEEMGAQIVQNWSNNNMPISHVLFKDGELRTLEKVVASNGSVKCVNIGWALDCERFNKWVPESSYLIDLSTIPGQTPAKRPTTTLNLSATPLPRTPNRMSPVKNLSPIKGTPFALTLTPKLRAASSTPQSNPNRSPAEDKENLVSPAQTYMDSPSTPYFLHAKDLVQQTCPPKQTQRGLFDQTAATPRTDGFKKRLMMARRSLSPVKMRGGMQW
ncbi:hypothetical protein K490DRAFT_68036 [Saccharata proteae CBS 121410]|uniref:BRCT domain-containing protein n=1 Tax=Saccharata proteae CBS 121410 TaxID=1314787 RepID=A0A9P4HNV7_9PEZI|nr:hypothetical protein K490DRAFT_68036 [Saccharata proteae CBS 121410]